MPAYCVVCRITTTIILPLIDLYSGLQAEGVWIWVDVDPQVIGALIGRQAFLHKDFDAIVVFEDLPAVSWFLRGRGFAPG